MKFLYILLSLLFLSISCTTYDPSFLTPLKANKPELRFWYMKSGEWIESMGHSADYFKAGDPKMFKVQTHPKMKECEVTYQDGDNNDIIDCEGKKEVIIDLGYYSSLSSSSISLSVLSKNSGTQIGHFYPYTKNKYRDLQPVFTCPDVSKSEGLNTCTRPGDFQFSVEVNPIQDKKVLELKYLYTCNSGYKDSGIINLDSNGHIFEFKHDYTEFCTLGLAMKDGTEKFASFIYIRYYNKDYAPIKKPYRSKSKYCIARDTSLYAYGEIYKSKNIFRRRCRKFSKGHIQSWNQYGQYNIIEVK